MKNSDAGDRSRHFLRLSQDIVNVECGPVACGHPIGATEGMLSIRLIHSMHRDGFQTQCS